jgi:predicted dehydrogenase
MPSRVLRIAVVGAGSGPHARAREYLATIVRLRHLYTLCAVCDVHEPTAREVAGTHGAAAYTDVRHMLERETPEVVFCLTPTDSQPVVALAAARAGAHILTEIPYGITLGVGDAIAEGCRQRGALWEVAEQVWLWPVERFKRQAIAAGFIGEPTHVRLQYASGAYHGFNAVRALLRDEPKRVLGHVHQVECPPYVAYGGDAMHTRVWEHAVVAFERGVACLFERPLSPAANRWEVIGTRGRLVGNELFVQAGDRERQHVVQESYVEANGRKLLAALRWDTEPALTWENPFLLHGIGSPDDIAKASILTAMHRSVVEGAPAQYGPDNARRDLEVWFAVWESARRGNAWVELPLPGRPTELEARIRAAYVEEYGDDPVEAWESLLPTRFGRKSVWWTVAQWL